MVNTICVPLLGNYAGCNELWLEQHWLHSRCLLSLSWAPGLELDSSFPQVLRFHPPFTTDNS